MEQNNFERLRTTFSLGKEKEQGFLLDIFIIVIVRGRHFVFGVGLLVKETLLFIFFQLMDAAGMIAKGGCHGRHLDNDSIAFFRQSRGNEDVLPVRVHARVVKRQGDLDEVDNRTLRRESVAVRARNLNEVLVHPRILVQHDGFCQGSHTER